MTRHPQVDKITFTGSVHAGQAVAAAAASDIKRVTLELGGNDAAIVLDDADPAAIARAIFWGAFTNCGQICAGIKRLYVPDALFGEMVDALAQLANRVRVGPASDERSQIGPVQNAMQFKRVCELTDEAVRQGAKPAAGGGAARPARLFLRAHRPHRCHRGHAGRRRGAVRPRAARTALLHRRRGDHTGQRHGLWPVWLGVES
jgi:acyl-CoA reductase-like NAD-dependent aldehyde dehydrogenase